MKKVLLFLVALSLLFVCGCSATDEGRISTVNGAEIIEFGSYDEAKYLVQLSVNPSVIMGYADDEVVYLVSNNEDGFKLLKEHGAKGILGESLDKAMGSFMAAAYEDGYDAEDFDVEIKYVSEEKGSAEDLMEMARKALENCDFEVTAFVEDGNVIYFNPEDGTDPICNVCNGKGALICENCEGDGEAIVIVQREKEVRNDYVCEICGGKGWIDDGMHGGEIGNCDSCGGMEGKMPSADFKEKAYDLVTVDEEELRLCEDCGGSGELECHECGGTGRIH